MSIESEVKQLADDQRSAAKENSGAQDKLHSGDFLSGNAAASRSSNGESLSGITQYNDGPNFPSLTFLKQQTDDTARKAQVDQVAGKLADYIEGANKSLDIAIYHFELSGSPNDPTSPMGKVVDALNDRAEHGVQIRLAVFEPPQKGTSNIDGEDSANGSESLNKLKKNAPTDPTNPSGANDNLTGLDPRIQVEGINGDGRLMHDKYIVRDGDTDKASIWTGSTNFTDDAFGSQDNNIIQIQSKDLASMYETDFQQMWDAKNIERTGEGLSQSVQVGDSTVRAAFSPGDGTVIDKDIADQIESATKSVHIASMDMSSQRVLQALDDKIKQGITVDGIYDGPQMDNVIRDWGKSNSPDSQQKLDLWNDVKQHLVEKHSHPYKPGQLADFMHNKAVDIDDNELITGSFNFSSNATHNAENIVDITNPTIAQQYGNYIQDLERTYGGANSST